MAQAAPIQLQERNKLVDILRGFALLGVLVANLQGFVTFTLPDEHIDRLVSSPIDKLTEILIALFIENKFITLFSLLFGYGFGVIMERIAAKGMNVASFFSRRMLILLVIGLLHIAVWWGEILSTYALCGIILILFRNASDRALLVWAGLFIFLITPLIQGLKLYLLPDASASTNALFANYLKAVHSGDMLLIAKYNFKLVDFIFIERWAQFRDMAEILGKFLLGYYFLRTKVLETAVPNKQLLKKAQLIASVIAAVYLVQKAVFPNIDSKELQVIQYTFERGGILALSLFYAITIALMFYKSKYKVVFEAFRNVGMMSLTNYLVHTVFYVLIYYGIGLALLGGLHLQWTIPIALSIYALQVAFSKFWMKKMHYGPVEWIWRQLSYGKRLKIRR